LFLALPDAIQREPVLSAAFGAGGGVLKTASHLTLLDVRGTVISLRDAPGGTAMFSFSADGAPAWVYFAASSELMNISSRESVGAAGSTVIALGPTGSASLPVLLVSGQQLWSGAVSLADGTLSRQSPVSGTGPGVYFEGGWITTSPDGLLWAPLPGAGGLNPRQIAIPEPVTSIQQAGASVTVNGHWLLNARFQVLEIPRGPQPLPRLQWGDPPGGRSGARPGGAH
jgi:hypothetical protein